MLVKSGVYSAPDGPMDRQIYILGPRTNAWILLSTPFIVRKRQQYSSRDDSAGKRFAIGHEQFGTGTTVLLMPNKVNKTVSL